MTSVRGGTCGMGAGGTYGMGDCALRLGGRCRYWLGVQKSHMQPECSARWRAGCPFTERETWGHP